MVMAKHPTGGFSESELTMGIMWCPRPFPVAAPSLSGQTVIRGPDDCGRMRVGVALLLVGSVLAAGCVGNLPNPGDTAPVLSGLLAGPSLWNDPQNAPHPAFNFGTLS